MLVEVLAAAGLGQRLVAVDEVIEDGVVAQVLKQTEVHFCTKQS